jgi:hypothetical protein
MNSVTHYFARRHTTTEAVARAYQRFASRHPLRAQSLLDEHFIARAVLPRLEREPAALTPETLALSWAEQLGVGSSGKGRVLAVLTPVMRDFLELLGQELEGQTSSAPSVRLGRHHTQTTIKELRH